MSRPLHRGVSGVRIPGDDDEYCDSQMKDRSEKEDLDRRGSSYNCSFYHNVSISVKFP